MPRCGFRDGKRGKSRAPTAGTLIAGQIPLPLRREGKSTSRGFERSGELPTSLRLSRRRPPTGTSPRRVFSARLEYSDVRRTRRRVAASGGRRSSGTTPRFPGGPDRNPVPELRNASGRAGSGRSASRNGKIPLAGAFLRRRTLPFRQRNLVPGRGRSPLTNRRRRKDRRDRTGHTRGSGRGAKGRAGHPTGRHNGAKRAGAPRRLRRREPSRPLGSNGFPKRFFFPSRTRRSGTPAEVHRRGRASLRVFSEESREKDPKPHRQSQRSQEKDENPAEMNLYRRVFLRAQS